MYDPAKPYKNELLMLIEDTWQTPYVSVKSGVYPIIKKKFSGLEIQHADGIGTKGVYHWRKKSFKNAVIDAFAMNANDLAMAGATPYAAVDHITTSDMGDTTVLAIVRALAVLCRKHHIALVGGETSHQDTLEGLDVSIIMSGFIKKPRINRFQVGDMLIGLKSSGLHSNGFTTVRQMYGKGEWREDFIRPTAIYLPTVLTLIKKYKIHGMMHITGGAFTKLHDLLLGADAIITVPRALAPQSIFRELCERGVSDRQMYTTFNCGVGFILSSSPEDARRVVSSTPHAAVIGRVEKGSGLVRIKSTFTGKTLVL
ncbi:MAG: AIR synthase-related protein [bacterium]|nr:AIR synthase-related protein [bacterium]